MRRYDPHDYTTWDWRADFRDADRERGFLPEWQIAAYPLGGNSPMHVASAQGGHAPEDERAAYLLAAAPDLFAALAFAKSVIVSGEPWTERCAEVIDGALRKAAGG
jgi:hypothetical protein